MTAPQFAPRRDERTIENGTALSPKFDADGLIVAIAVDADRGDVLMVAHMNADALARTKSFLAELERTGDLSIAKLTLANSQIHELAAH